MFAKELSTQLTFLSDDEEDKDDKPSKQNAGEHEIKEEEKTLLDEV